MIHPRRVVFRCITCCCTNRLDFGRGFELRPETFESLTEAWTHMLENAQEPHRIIAEEED